MQTRRSTNRARANRRLLGVWTPTTFANACTVVGNAPSTQMPSPTTIQVIAYFSRRRRVRRRMTKKTTSAMHAPTAKAYPLIGHLPPAGSLVVTGRDGSSDAVSYTHLRAHE